MATINSRELIADIINANGALYDDEPPVTRIVEYINAWGKTTWGVVWAHEPNQDRYDYETEYINNPKVIFVRQ